MTVIPFGLFLAESAILYSTETNLSMRSIRSLRNFSSKYLALPGRKRSTLTLLPSPSHSEVFLAFSARSWSPVPSLTCTVLISTEWDFLVDLDFLFSSYKYLPKLAILATGGVAVGEISIRSKENSSPFLRD